MDMNFSQVSLGTVYTVIFIIVLLFAAWHGYQQGFLSGVFGLLGSLAGIFGAVWATNRFSQPLYDNYLGAAVSSKVTEALSETGGDLSGAVAQLDFLPETVRESLQEMLGTATGALPKQITEVLDPLLLPLIQVLVFVICCVAIRWVFKLVVGLLRGANHIPLLGGMNRMLGFVLGLATGLVDCWLLALLLWGIAGITVGQLEFLNATVLQQSEVYGFFAQLNPFL